MNVNLSTITQQKRLDPEYYYKKNKKHEKTIFLEEVADIKVGSTPKRKDTGSIPMYRVEDIQKWSIRTPKAHIKEDLINKENLAIKGDMLLSVKGRVGDGVIVEKKGYYNQDIACLKTKNIHSFVLLSLIHSRFVQGQLQRVSTNQMHPYIRVTDLKKIKIPKLTNDQNKRIIQKVTMLEQSQKEIKQIQKNINNFLKVSNMSSKSYTTIQEINHAHRFDPEFFESFDNKKLRQIKDLKNITIKVGRYVKSYNKTGIPYLRAQNISEGKIKLNKYVKPINDQLTKPGEVLLTRVGNIKAIYIKNEKVIPSDNFLRIKHNDKSMPPQILASFFNSSPGQIEIQRHMQGSKQKRINKKSLLEVHVPNLSNKEKNQLITLLHNTTLLQTKIMKKIQSIQFLTSNLL